MAIGRNADSIGIHLIYGDNVYHMKGVFTGISCGTNHALLLDESNRLFAVGSNRLGQCGTDSSEEEVCVPSPIACRVELATTGPSSSFYKTDDGLLFAFGENRYSQLGLGTSEGNISIRSPTRVGIRGMISRISSGFTHTCIVSDGKLYGCGFNSHGQLDFVCDRNDRVTTFTGSSEEFPFIIISVSCGLWCTGIVTNSGDLYICGHPPEFQDKPQFVDDLLSENEARSLRRKSWDGRINGMQRLPYNVKFAEFAVGSSIALGLLENRRIVWVIDLVDYKVLETISVAHNINHISINGRHFSFS